MKSLRYYIDLIEAFGYAQQPQRTFGRKGTEDFPRQEPQDEQRKKELARCRDCKTADEYNRSFNKYYPPSNVDPPHVRRLYQDEANRLMARWNHLKQMGYLDTPL